MLAWRMMPGFVGEQIASQWLPEAAVRSCSLGLEGCVEGALSYDSVVCCAAEGTPGCGE